MVFRRGKIGNVHTNATRSWCRCSRCERNEATIKGNAWRNSETFPLRVTKPDIDLKSDCRPGHKCAEPQLAWVYPAVGRAFPFGLEGQQEVHTLRSKERSRLFAERWLKGNECRPGWGPSGYGYGCGKNGAAALQDTRAGRQDLEDEDAGVNDAWEEQEHWDENADVNAYGDSACKYAHEDEYYNEGSCYEHEQHYVEAEDAPKVQESQAKHTCASPSKRQQIPLQALLAKARHLSPKKQTSTARRKVPGFPDWQRVTETNRCSDADGFCLLDN